MGISFGRYELLKRIAAGGMGEVFLARQAGLEGFEKLLVVKVLLPHLAEDEEFTTMFLDEARIAARLNHPNIGQIYDLGEVDGAYYIAMEYIHGDDVVRLWKTARAKEKLVPLPLAARIAADAAAGLDYAHKAVDGNNRPLNLVHRDVSPQNILVTFDGGVKLIDFGVAKATGRMSRTATGTLKGKYSYMSPEQAEGAAIDRRSDIFALGVVLYEMCTSVRLFKRETEICTLKAVSACEIPKPSEVNPGIDPLLESVMLKSLAQKPDDRFQDAQAFRLALEEWLVQTRQSGSAAHLAAFMQGLYADRLAEERADGRPFSDFEGTPSAIFRRQSIAQVAPDGTVRARPGASKATENLEWQAEKTAAAGSGAPAKSMKPMLIGALAALGLLIVGAGAAVALWPRTPAVVAPPPAQAATLSVTTEPAGATVRLDAKEVGVTPLDGHQLQGGGHVQLELSLPGYKTVRLAVPAVGPQSINRILEREPVVTEPIPDKAVAPDEVAISLTSKPSGATVLQGSDRLGTTPLVVRLPKGVAQTFEVRLAGYKTARRSLTPSVDDAIEVELQKAPVRRNDPLDIKVGR